MDRSLLERGLAVISACRRTTGDIWEAHFGAAAIAAYCFVRENGISGSLAKTIEAQAHRMVAGHLRDGQDGSSRRDGASSEMKLQFAERMIVEALDETIDELHWVGHNVIYAALSLKAMRELGGWGTEEEVGGIADLIRAFKGKIPGRSWIGFTASEVKRLPVEALRAAEPAENGRELSKLVLRELAAFRTIYRAEAHHDLIGHMLTFSHSLALLDELGCKGLFDRGLTPLFKLIAVLRTTRDLAPGEPIRLVSPVDSEPLAPASPSPWLPTEPAFWERDRRQDDWDFGHAFKFPFSFYAHVNSAGGADEAACRNFRLIL